MSVSHKDRVQTNWSYGHRTKGRTYAGLEASEELVNVNGMHFHFWVPAGPLAETYEKVDAAVKACRSERDVVNWSWAFIPAE